jgi:hypothetical protein
MIKRIWFKLHGLFLEHRKIVLISLAVLVIFGIGLTVFLISSQSSKTSNKKTSTVKISKPVEKKPEPVKYYSKLTGNIVANDTAVNQSVTGVMIDNSPESRPQSGLKDSGVVFEAIAEGGITRFLVIYQQEKPQMVGPVRSVRLYDLDWLIPFNASLAHVGGSAAALVEVRNGNYRDLDEFFNTSSYWRTADRYAPHNMYTNFEKLDTLNAKNGYTSSYFKGFSRSDGKPVDKPDATDINITISSFLYNSSYAYDINTNNYRRFQGGQPHLDRENGQITPSVVIAMKVDEVTVLEDGYRQSIATVGSGEATIFQNGTAIKAIWIKSSINDQITFTDANRVIIPLVRGQTWITAVPNDGGDVTWK